MCRLKWMVPLSLLLWSTMVATPALAWIHEQEDVSFSKGNSDVRGKINAVAGFLSCSEAELDASVVWHIGWGEAVQAAASQGIDPVVVSMAYLAQNPRPNPCPGQAGSGVSSVYATGEAKGRIFGRQESLIYVELEARSVGAESSIFGWVRVMGATVLQREEGPMILHRGVSFEKSRGFSLGPLSISVKGRVAGMVGVGVDGGAAVDYVALAGEPFAVGAVSASATVGALCASAGIEGHISLLEVSLPVLLELDLADRAWSVEVDLEYELPQGSLDLVASWCAGSDSFEIASFDFGGGVTPVFNAIGAY